MMSDLKPYPKYKDSGVPWLGEVPEHWDITHVRRLFKIQKRIAGIDGYDVLSITQQGIKIKDISSGVGQLSMDYSKYQFVEVGDFAMNHMDLLTGYVDISNRLGVTSPDYRVFRLLDNMECSARYYLYLFQNAYRNRLFFPFGQGSAQLGRWRLPRDEFYAFHLPRPTFQEQSAIVRFLDHADRKIRRLIHAKQKLIKLLEEQKQVIINQAVTKGLNPDAPMKDSGVEWLGEVPEHWNLMDLRYLATKFGSGITPRGGATVYQRSGVPFIRSQNVHFNGLELTNVVYIKQELHDALSNTHVYSGDILLNITGASICRVCAVPNDFNKGNVNQHVCIIRPRLDKVTANFLSNYPKVK